MTVIDRMVASYNHEVVSELDESIDAKQAARLSGLAVTNLMVAEMTKWRLDHTLSQAEQHEIDEDIVASIFDFDALLRKLGIVKQYDDGRTVYDAIRVGEYGVLSSETRDTTTELLMAVPQTMVGGGTGLIYERQIDLAVPDMLAEYPLDVENSRLIGRLSLRHCAAVFPKTTNYVSDFSELVDTVYENAAQ